MYCPVCQTQNSNDVEVCSKCGFKFASPGGKNHEGSAFSKYFAFDLINGVTLGLALLLLMFVFLGYMFWSIFNPVVPWVLATQADQTKIKLYALSWKSGQSLELGESEGDWTPQFDLALDLPDQIGSPHAPINGIWNGGGVVYAPTANKVVTALKHKDGWQVNITNLSNEERIVFETEVSEPFISMAPNRGVAAISIQATNDNPAQLKVFEGMQELQIDQPFDETVFPNGRVSPDGTKLLYTMTSSETTSDESSYNTAFQIQDLKSRQQTTIYEFDHESRNLAGSYAYAFTPDSQSVIYQTSDMSLHQTRLEDLETTQVYTPAENVTAIQWFVSPASDYVTLFAANSDNRSEVEFLLISLDSGHTKVIDQSFNPNFVGLQTFLDASHLLYFSGSDEQIILDLTSGTPENFRAKEGAFLNCPAISRDRSLVSFGLLDQQSANFHFYNLARGDVSNLDFGFDSPVFSLDLAAKYILFGDESGIFYKDVLGNTEPVKVPVVGERLQSAVFSPDLRYLIYTANSDGQPSIRMIKLGEEQSQLLMDQAELLAPLPYARCINQF